MKFKPYKLDLQFFAADGAQPMYTEAEAEERIERVVAARLQRQENKYQKMIDDLKGQLDSGGSNQMAELQEKLQDIQAEAADYKQKTERLETENHKMKLQQAFVKEAQRLRIEQLDDAMALADLDKATIDEEGNVQGMRQLVSELVSERPYLKRNMPNIGEGVNPGPHERGKGEAIITKKQFQNMKYADRVKLYASNPELFNELYKD